MPWAAGSAVETIHSQSKLMAFGLEGTVEEWVSADGRHRVDLDLAGLFTTTLVRSADGCWLLDQNGKVSNQTGFDRQSEITAVYLATWSHLLPDRMAGQVKYLGSEPETNHAIVSCTPKDGIKITFYIDAEQFLPIRSRQLTAAGEIQTITYEDWREIDGVLLPGTIRQSTGVPENDMLFLQDQVSLNSAPDTDTFDRPSETVDDVRFSSGNSARDIPLDVNGVHPFLQVQVNDSEPLCRSGSYWIPELQLLFWIIKSLLTSASPLRARSWPAAPAREGLRRVLSKTLLFRFRGSK